MIPVTPEIREALKRSPITRTVNIDLTTHEDLTAGQSVVMIGERRYGVVRYERRGHIANATLVELDSHK